MSGLALLIPVALGMGALGLLVFFWAMRNGQFEDLDGAAHRILIDDEDSQPAEPARPSNLRPYERAPEADEEAAPSDSNSDSSTGS